MKRNEKKTKATAHKQEEPVSNQIETKPEAEATAEAPKTESNIEVAVEVSPAETPAPAAEQPAEAAQEAKPEEAQPEAPATEAAQPVTSQPEAEKTVAEAKAEAKAEEKPPLNPDAVKLLAQSLGVSVEDLTKKLTTIKPKAEKAPKEPKAPKPPKELKPRTTGGDDRVITVLVTANPKKTGSATHERFKLYKTGMTVTEFLKAGGMRVDLPWDEQRGFIRLDVTPKPEAAAEAPKTEGEAPAEQPKTDTSTETPAENKAA